MAAVAVAMAAFTDLIWGTFVMHAKKGERGGDGGGGGGGLDQQHCIVPRRVDHPPREGNPFFPVVGEGARSALLFHSIKRAEQYSCRWGEASTSSMTIFFPYRFLRARPIPDLSDLACVTEARRA